MCLRKHVSLQLEAVIRTLLQRLALQHQVKAQLHQSQQQLQAQAVMNKIHLPAAAAAVHQPVVEALQLLAVLAALQLVLHPVARLTGLM